MTPLEALAEDQRRQLPPWLDEEPVSPRPTSDYQTLLSEGADDAQLSHPTTPSEPPTAGPDGPDGGCPPPP